MAVSMLNRLNGRNPPRTLSQLDDLRQVIRRDVIDGGSQADGHFGELMLDAIDERGGYRFAEFPVLYRQMKNLFAFYTSNSRKFGCGDALMKMVSDSR